MEVKGKWNLRELKSVFKLSFSIRLYEPNLFDNKNRDGHNTFFIKLSLNCFKNKIQQIF